MKKHNLLFAVLLATGLSTAAETVVQDGCTFELRTNNKMRLVSITENVQEQLIVPSTITVTADNDDVSYSLSGILNDAIKSSSLKMIEVADNELNDTKYALGTTAIADCPELTEIVFHNNLDYLPSEFLIKCPLVKTVVLDKTSVCEVVGFSTSMSAEEIEAYVASLGAVKLYVPDNLIEDYKNYTKADALAWSAFDIQPLSKYNEGGDDPIVPEHPQGVRLILSNGGDMMLRNMMPGHIIEFPTDANWTLVSLYFNGDDVIDQLDNNAFLVPDYAGEATLNPVYSEKLSVFDAQAASTKVRVSGHTVEIFNSTLGKEIYVYDLNGNSVMQTRATSFTLPTGVYILKAGQRTFKFGIGY